MPPCRSGARGGRPVDRWVLGGQNQVPHTLSILKNKNGTPAPKKCGPIRREGRANGQSRWVRDKKKRDILMFFGAGIAAIAAAGWAVFTFVHARDNKGSVTYNLCIGPKDGKKWCPAGTLFVLNVGLNTVSDWAKKECSKYNEKQVYHPTRECNCFVVKIVCNLL
jgi:hypothetical protein